MQKARLVCVECRETKASSKIVIRHNVVALSVLRYMAAHSNLRFSPFRNSQYQCRWQSVYTFVFAGKSNIGRAQHFLCGFG